MSQRYIAKGELTHFGEQQPQSRFLYFEFIAGNDDTARAHAERVIATRLEEEASRSRIAIDLVPFGGDDLSVDHLTVQK